MRMTKVDANNVRNECPYQTVLAILDQLQCMGKWVASFDIGDMSSVRIVH